MEDLLDEGTVSPQQTDDQTPETESLSTEGQEQEGQQEQQEGQEAESWEAIDPSTPGPALREHKKVLENARQKAREEAEAQYSYLQGYQPQDVTRALALADLMQENPQAVIHMLGGGQQSQQTQQGPAQETPDIKFPEKVLDQYTGAYYYKTEDVERYIQAKIDHALTQADQKVAERLQPFEEQTAQSEQQRQLNAQLQHYEETLPGFKEILAEGHLARELQKDRRATVLSAYRRLYDTWYLPKQKTGQRTELMSTLNKKTQASREGRPAGNVGTKAKSSKDFQSMRGTKGFDAAMAEVEAELAGQQ